MSKKSLKNPRTGKKIKFGGPTHLRLIEKGILDKLGEEKTKNIKYIKYDKDEVVNVYMDYSVTKDGVKYQMVNLPERADQIVSSNISSKSKAEKMIKIFRDFRYQNTVIREKVDYYFDKISVSDLTNKFVEAQKLFARSNLKEGRKEILSVFSDFRFRRSGHAKYIIIESILKTPKKEIEIRYGQDKTKTNFDLIHDSATPLYAKYEDFDRRIPLGGDYVLKDDFEILELAIKHDEVMFLQFLVAANINIIKKKDSGLYNRLVKYIDDNLENSLKLELGVFSIILKASDLGKMEIDGLLLLGGIKKVLGMVYEDDYDYDAEDKIQEYVQNPEKGENYKNLLKELKMSYDPKKDSIAGFFQRIKSYVGSGVKLYPYILTFIDYDYRYKKKFRTSEMLISNDNTRKLLLDQIVDYYVKIMNMDTFSATQHLQEDIEDYFTNKKAFEFKDILNYKSTWDNVKYSQEDIKKTEVFLVKIKKDVEYLKKKAKVLKSIAPGGLEYLKVAKSFKERQKKK